MIAFAAFRRLFRLFPLKKQNLGLLMEHPKLHVLMVFIDFCPENPFKGYTDPPPNKTGWHLALAAMCLPLPPIDSLLVNGLLPDIRMTLSHSTCFPNDFRQASNGLPMRGINFCGFQLYSWRLQG